MATILHARADVRTDRPARYAAQLAKHLGHRIETAWEEPRGFIQLADDEGRCEMRAEPGSLVLDAYAADEAGLAHIQDVVKRHLERFGVRDGIAVAWDRVGEA
jgi:uncharacterized protein